MRVPRPQLKLSRSGVARPRDAGSTLNAGKLKWRFPSQSLPWERPWRDLPSHASLTQTVEVAEKDRGVVLTRSHHPASRLYAVDPGSGKLVWQLNTDGPTAANITGIDANSGVAYVMLQDQEGASLRALGAANGDPLWASGTLDELGIDAIVLFSPSTLIVRSTQRSDMTVNL